MYRAHVKDYDADEKVGSTNLELTHSLKDFASHETPEDLIYSHEQNINVDDEQQRNLKF